ncbi:9140_t:CDS:1, partial [Entrophospora sp. SA101]
IQQFQQPQPMQVIKPNQPVPRLQKNIRPKLSLAAHDTYQPQQIQLAQQVQLNDQTNGNPNVHRSNIQSNDIEIIDISPPNTPTTINVSS